MDNGNGTKLLLQSMVESQREQTRMINDIHAYLPKLVTSTECKSHRAVYKQANMERIKEENANRRLLFKGLILIAAGVIGGGSAAWLGTLAKALFGGP